MAAKDIAEKLLEEHNDVFADIFNVLLFKKDFVNPEELSDAPTEFHYWTKDQKGCRELRRDVAKLLRFQAGILGYSIAGMKAFEGKFSYKNQLFS